MEKKSQRPQVGMLGCDRDLFSRVWERAGAHNDAASPIEILPRSSPAPAAQKNTMAIPSPSAVDRAGSDHPLPNDVPCFGSDGTDHAQFLQERIRAELEGWRSYQFLSARGSGSTARTLATMAADERRHAQRLSGAYFLISGIRFFPQIPAHRPNSGNFWHMLRQAFWAEQKDAAVYAAAAAETADLCLASLYRELAAEEGAHADLLRALVEKMPAN